ncbi:MAG: hypothetical protein C0502_00935 [Opitutus sp.]|nr:hypothetical protein [Opitutus sp.]
MPAACADARARPRAPRFLSNPQHSSANSAVVEAARRRHATALRSYAVELRPGDKIDAEALLAATWEALSRQPEPESDDKLAAWLFSDVRRRALAGHRSGGLADDRGAEDDVSAEAIFERLTPKQQEVLLLKFAHGFRHGQIAQIVELSPANAAQLLHVALTRLAPAFRAEGSGGDAGLRGDHRLTLAALGELDGEAWRAWEAEQVDVAAANGRLEQVRRAGKWTTGYLVSGRRRRQRGKKRSGRPWIIGAAMIFLGVAATLYWPRGEEPREEKPLREQARPTKARVAVPQGGGKGQTADPVDGGTEAVSLGVYREPESRLRETTSRPEPVGAVPAGSDDSLKIAEPAAPPRGAADALKVTAPKAELRGIVQGMDEPAGHSAPVVPAGAAPRATPEAQSAGHSVVIIEHNLAAPRATPAAQSAADEVVRQGPVKPSQAATVAPTDTAAIVALKRALGHGRWPQPEEVNPVRLAAYFSPPARGGERAALFGKSLESATAPWDSGAVLLRATAQAPEAPPALRAPANVILLLDVSGSMDAPNRLPLVQEAVRGLLDRLRPEDRVGLVTYAGESRVLLAPAELTDVRRVRETVLGLEARGRTNGGAGLAKAFALARQDGRAHGEHVVILCTDGDFNMGETSEEELAAGVRVAAGAGVRLAIFGFGRPGEIDPRLERLAALGRGGSGYVNTRADAISVMLAQLDELIAPSATDVRLGLRTEGGARGAALAEKLLPSDTVATLVATRPDDPAEAVLEYRLARGGEERTESARGRAALREFRAASPEFRFAAAVHRFAELLSGPPAQAEAEFDDLEVWARESVDDAGGYRAEFLALLAQARTAAAAAR